MQNLKNKFSKVEDTETQSNDISVNLKSNSCNIEGTLMNKKCYQENKQNPFPKRSTRIVI